MALPNYQDIVDLLKKGATVEAQEQIMALREGALELQEENLRLREENAELLAKLNQEETLNFDGKVYWRETEGEKEGPFCPTCLDTESKQVRLHNGGQFSDWHCHSCKFTN